MHINGLAGLLLLLFLLAGCKKEDDPTVFKQITFDSQKVLDLLPAGLTNSTDQFAKECVGMIKSAFDMSDFIDNLEVPPEAQKMAGNGTKDTWSWTWENGGQAWKFYWSQDEDNSKMYWTMEIQFGDGLRYDYIEAWEAKDGSGGEVIYNFNWPAIEDGEAASENLYLRISWQVDSSGNYLYNWYRDSNTETYAYLWHYDIVLSADGSGSIEYYLADERYYHMDWDAQGNGSWTYYYGSIESSGTWVAG